MNAKFHWHYISVWCFFYRSYNHSNINGNFNFGRVMRKSAFCLCEKKSRRSAAQLKRAADQRLYIRYIDSTNPLIPKSEIAGF